MEQSSHKEAIEAACKSAEENVPLFLVRSNTTQLFTELYKLAFFKGYIYSESKHKEQCQQ